MNLTPAQRALRDLVEAVLRVIGHPALAAHPEVRRLKRAYKDWDDALAIDPLAAKIETRRRKREHDEPL